MIISEKQLIFLHQVLIDTLHIFGSEFKFSTQARRDMADQIFNQQSDKLIEVKDE